MDNNTLINNYYFVFRYIQTDFEDLCDEDEEDGAATGNWNFDHFSFDLTQQIIDINNEHKNINQ